MNPTQAADRAGCSVLTDEAVDMENKNKTNPHATRRTALITGITGQDGAYLAEFLIAKGYEVHGIKRRSSSFNTARIDPLYQDPHVVSANLFLHYGDMSDATNLIRIINDTRPDEIYNLAAQSHVKVSFETPEYTANVDGLGLLRILEAVRILKMTGDVRVYQASTSELYGQAAATPQNETTPFAPRSPYAAAKLYAYWIACNYREAYDMFVSNGILFNHESPFRGETFVTRKITRAVAAVSVGTQDVLYLGNLDSTRDWGDARDYVKGMWMIANHSQPDDFVLATGEGHTVREFAEMAFELIGKPLEWRGAGRTEQGIEKKTGQVRVEIDPRYYRPTEVERLIGDPSKAERVLGWRPTVSFEQLVRDMVEADMRSAGEHHHSR